MKIKYKGSDAHRRIIQKRHFEAIGVTDQGDVIFGVQGKPEEPAVQEVSDSAGKWLVANDDFEAVSDSQPEPVEANEATEAEDSTDATPARGGRSTSRS